MASRFDARFQTYAIHQQNREFGYEIRLKRGNLLTDSFIGRKHYERSHEAMGQEIGLSVKVERQSWVVPISAMTLNGESITPQQTDKLIVGSEVWEVHAPDDGTPPTEKQQSGYDFIVHTRLAANG